jgi:glycosyltransferase involved in cell wall biosynthesis
MWIKPRSRDKLRTMIIGIDASRANKPQKTGVEWYAFHVIEELKKLTAGDKHQWVLYTREPLTGPLAQLPANWYEVRAAWSPKYLWTQGRMAWEMWRRPIDVFFVPAHVLPIIRPEKSVVTIHDIGFHRYPKLYKPAQTMYHEQTSRHIASTDARIITVSQFSGQDIAEAYGVDTRRIAITPNGIDHDTYKPKSPELIADALRRLQIPQPYFFSIGRLEAKKNIVNTVKAFNSYKNHRGQGDPTRLVLAGPKGFQYDQIKKEIQASPYKDHIIELGYVSEEDKPLLIAGARALIHVSWYEGFGIPPVEAQAIGTPVVASNNTCLPEILGEGNALFVPPDQPDMMARALDRLENEPGLVESLRSKGIANAAKYTWKATAEATLPVLTQWIG